MQFTIDDGIPLDSLGSPPLVKKILKLVETLEDGKLVTNRRLAYYTKVQESTIRGWELILL